MNVKVCGVCGTLFNTATPAKLCPRCVGKLEVQIQKTEKYIRACPEADIDEVSIMCNVEISRIQEWIRGKRLIPPENSRVRIPCEKCGAMIRFGKFCEACSMERQEVVNELSWAFRADQMEADRQAETVRNGAGMHYFRRQK